MMIPASDPRDILRLARTERVGPVTLRRLLVRYPNAAEAIEALPVLAGAAGRAPPRVPPRSDAEREIAALARIGGRFVCLGTDAYPPLLALTADAPAALAVLGDPAALLAPRPVAIVGGRNASINGRKIAEIIAGDLAGSGILVVSGMARGIDAAAHTGALRTSATGPRTVAVVAGGLDVPYPPEHASLQEAIAAGGAVIAESPLGTEPRERHFPRRNRLIAGLSLGIVVIEAAIRSGSLITARLGIDAGRELFAVPGSPLDPRCQGANDLIRQGAHLTESAADVRANLPHDPHPPDLFAAIAPGPLRLREDAPALPEGSAGDCETLLELLSPDPVAVDDLMRGCHLSPAAIQAALLELEIAGRVEVLAGNRVARL